MRYKGLVEVEYTGDEIERLRALKKGKAIVHDVIRNRLNGSGVYQVCSRCGRVRKVAEKCEPCLAEVRRMLAQGAVEEPVNSR